MKEIDPLTQLQAWMTAYNIVEAERHAQLVEMIVADHVRDFAQKLSKPAEVKARVGEV